MLLQSLVGLVLHADVPLLFERRSACVFFVACGMAFTVGWGLAVPGPVGTVWRRRRRRRCGADFDSMVFPQAMALDSLVASHPIEVKVRNSRRTSGHVYVCITADEQTNRESDRQKLVGRTLTL